MYMKYSFVVVTSFLCFITKLYFMYIVTSCLCFTTQSCTACRLSPLFYISLHTAVLHVHCHNVHEVQHCVVKHKKEVTMYMKYSFVVKHKKEVTMYMKYSTV
jgi:hypothetical protein